MPFGARIISVQILAPKLNSYVITVKSFLWVIWHRLNQNRLIILSHGRDISIYLDLFWVFHLCFVVFSNWILHIFCKIYMYFMFTGAVVGHDVFLYIFFVCITCITIYIIQYIIVYSVWYWIFVVPFVYLCSIKKIAGHMYHTHIIVVKVLVC